MTTKTSTKAKATPVAAKPAAAKPAAAKPAAAKPAAAKPAATSAATSAVKATYREAVDFTPALKAAKSLSKGSPEMSMAVQLITHLAWKTPGGSVGWAKGTTATVVAFADDLAVPTGTPIPQAMDAALSAAAKGATDKPQKDAVAVLAKVIKSHN